MSDDGLETRGWFRERYVDLDGGRLAYRRAEGDRGSRPVVMIHGGASTGRTWDRLAADLIGDGRIVVAPDLRGHGSSFRSRDYSLSRFVDDVVALLSVLEPGPLDLVGHSLGAWVALDVAARRPGRIERMVVEEPPAPPIAVRRTARTAMWMGVFGALRTPVRRDCDYRAVRSVLDELREPSPSWWRGLTAIAAPTLVLDGGSSSHVSSEDLAHIAERLPGGRLHTVAVGHRIHSLAYPRYRDLVRPWLR